ncbi:4a-hydroxytetrahydrobiopterin dehydratase [Nocardioides sp. Soil805]|uniref:4a-hydroxytetrahydrobiopterin dehydratase n=1 Tax=Nocardioides sp. Soil805 TaxID=1736416 RepID=UPI000B31C681|nr:4a-hydroxytetrahydrobiopterin dehydratase [Nocardioides sp. Soil805]
MSDSTSDRVTYDDVAAAGLDDWRMLVTGIHARFRTGSFAAGVRLVDAIGAAADEADHHPDVTLTYPRVDVALVSHDVGRVTDRDLALARRISEIAAEQGLTADPSGLQQLELGLDSPDQSAVLPFWRELLAFRAGDDDITDPHGRLPAVWFQESGSDEPRQRWHLDVWVPGDQVQARIDAVVAGGGRLVAEYPEHSFWVLEDAQGNRSCVCTAQGR